MDPMISLLRLQHRLKDRGFVTYKNNPIEENYLKKLIHKLNRQSQVECDQTEISERLGKTRERFALMIEKLFKIAFWREEYLHEGYLIPKYQDQIKAMSAIAKMDLALLQAEMDAGVFERHLGTLDIDVARRKPIPENLRENAWKVFKNWGLVPRTAEMPKLENGSDKQQLNNAIEPAAADTERAA